MDVINPPNPEEATATVSAPRVPAMSGANMAIAAIAVAGLAAAFWPLFRWLPTIWFGDDSYYAHGAVVPICAGLIAWDRWPTLSQRPMKGVSWALLPFLGLLYVTWFAHRTDMHTVQSVLIIAVLMVSVLFVAGWRWLQGLAVPILYLAFGFPLFDRFVDTYTVPIQMASTEASFGLLKLFQRNPMRLDTTTILLNNFTLDVGVPCSGMKLLLAVMAISVFFILVAKLRWWGNAILLVSVLPLCLLINALRIAMIGMVGDSMGSDAGHTFHDYSGYIGLAICFVILMKLTRVLGWK